MKIKKDLITGITVLVIIAFAMGGIILYQLNKSRNTLAARIAEISAAGTPQSIEELRSAIAVYEDQIEQHIKDVAQTGVYWKILATRLQDRGLHNEALEALERAVYYAPEDPAPYYLTGVSAGIVAKSSLDFAGAGGNSARSRYFDLAESAYLRAIALDERYARPRYGLSVLYLFELNRPEDAIPHLSRYLETQTRDVDAMFLLARAYYMTERYEESLALYDRIIPLTRDTVKRAEAERNKETVLGLLYG
ncbi:MAG: tetratricopeptide repeat protein [Treponema sp.]|jgi:tetratricopeptide (TPR) repeat protein|nr:tetratricopeptide repeat protein [Treponema sp.]